MEWTLSYSIYHLGSVEMFGPFSQFQCQIKNLGWWAGNIFGSTRIKTAYYLFHIPLLNHPSLNQHVSGRFLPKFSSHYSHKFSCNKVLDVAGYILNQCKTILAPSKISTLPF